MPFSPFALNAPALIAGGCSPMPIAPAGSHEWSPKGKEPGRLDHRSDGEAEWVRLKAWNVFCKRQAHPAIVAYWSTWPDTGIGIACGFNNLVGVDIDRDDLIEPLLAVLPPMVVAKRGRKGMTIFYRGAEPWTKANYKAESGEGVLDFLAYGSQTVLPPTIHPDTGRPYEWVTERTLLNTAVADLPPFTQADKEAMERVLADHGWQPKTARQTAPATAAAGSSAHSAVSDYITASDELNSAALANIGAWAPLLNLPKGHWQGSAYRGVAHWRNSGSGRDGAARAANLSISPFGIKDFGDDRSYTATAVVHYALGLPWIEADDWLCARLGITRPPPIVLHNGAGDGRKPLPQAEAALRDAFAAFFAAVPAALIARQTYENACTLAKLGVARAPLWEPVRLIAVVKAETAIGKSTAMNAAVTAYSGPSVIAVPTQDLAQQTVANLRAIGVSAEAYRGYDQRDPRAPEHNMCRNPVALKAARDTGVGIRAAVCVRRVDGELKRCPFALDCGAEKQRDLKPRVWVIQSAMLPNPRPDFIPAPDVLVIDEAFIAKCIAAPVKIPLADLIGAVDGPYNAEDRAALQNGRQRLVTAVLKSCEHGGRFLSRAALNAQAINADHAGWMADLERRRIDAGDLKPGLSASAMKAAAKKQGAVNKRARDLSDLWDAIEWFRVEGHELSGRITIKEGALIVTALRPVHSDWNAPTLVLDATPSPELTLFDTAFCVQPGTAKVVADIMAKWPAHVQVRQLLNAPASMNRLGLLDKKRPEGPPGPVPGRDNVRDILRHIQMRAAEVAPAYLGLITYKALLELIRDKLPWNVRARNFGGLAGMNDMQDVAGLIVIGRPTPWHTDVERAAGVWLGYPVDEIGFDRVRAKIGDRTVAVDRHRHPTVEALRWLVTDAGLLQAVGRLRPHRRAAPCWLEIINDVALNLPGIVAADWQKPGAVAEMAPEGFVLTNRRDVALVFGISERQGRDVVVGGRLGTNPYIYINRGSYPTSPTRQFRYQRHGPGKRMNDGWILPNVLTGGEQALRARLESKLGPLVLLEIERVRAKDSDFAQAIFEHIGRDANARCERIGRAAESVEAAE